MTKKTRIIAATMAILVLVVMLFSAAYIAVEAGHDCTGEHCPICEQIIACVNTLTQLSLPVVVISIISGLAYSFCPLIPLQAHAKKHITLITLKVKLSN